MRSLRISLFLLVFLLILPSQTSAGVEHLYTEKISGYHRVNGETLRWNLEREFAIQDYVFYNISEIKYVNVSLIDDSQNGLLHIETQEMKRMNFLPEIEFWNNGSLKNVNWQITLFRNPTFFGNPFESEDSAIFYDSNLGHRRYDQYVEPRYFTLALEHFEFHVVDGELVKLKVNSEFATDNYEDGRSFRTALHIIKRTPEGEILFDYNYSFQEANNLYDLLNILDQPVFWVPLRIGSVFFVVYLYIRISRWIRKSGYRLVKEEEVAEEEKSDGKKEENL